MKTALGRVCVPAMLCAALALPGCAHETSRPATGVQRQPAPEYAELETDDLDGQLRDEAPLRYTVKPGDTLWDIAGYYLRDPWYWPQLWYDNPDIANPHRIYPGQVLVLTRNAAGQPRLGRDRSIHLSPHIRTAPVSNAIATIPLDAIRPFLTGPRLVDADTLDAAPYVVSFADEHLVGGAGTTVYVRGAAADGPQRYSLVRHAGAYTDPETGDILGQKAVPIGDVRIDEFGAIDAATITHSTREALTGDRLLPVEHEDLIHDFYPHAPAQPIVGEILSVYGGVTAIGQYDVVTLDVGENDGIERGHVLHVYDTGRTVQDPVAGDAVKLPPRRAGELLVFKTQPRVSFAVIMRARRAIHVSDTVHTPGA